MIWDLEIKDRSGMSWPDAITEQVYEELAQVAAGRFGPFDPEWGDASDLILDAPSGLIPEEAPTTRDVMGPRDRGRRS